MRPRTWAAAARIDLTVGDHQFPREARLGRRDVDAAQCRTCIDDLPEGLPEIERRGVPELVAGPLQGVQPILARRTRVDQRVELRSEHLRRPLRERPFHGLGVLVAGY